MAQSVSTVTNANAFTFTWQDAFSNLAAAITNPAEAYGEARAEALPMGVELADDLLRQHVKEVHFIGHSLGTWVNAYASQILIANGVNVLQDTILDRPEGKIGALTTPLLGGPAETALFAQTLPGVGWVDNYYGNDELSLTPATGATLPSLPGTTVYNQEVNGDHGGVHDW
jgi:hypothetical protein